jgi:hypothetical protein
MGHIGLKTFDFSPKSGALIKPPFPGALLRETAA